jgi:hypothetical protein
MKTVLTYMNTSKEVGDLDHLKVFANEQAAENRHCGVGRSRSSHALSSFL